MPSALRIVGRACRDVLNNKCLDPIDRRGDHSQPFSHPPIFILGAPRSGSTLLSQILIQSLDVGYFSNLHAQFYGAPSLIEWASTFLNHAPHLAFESTHGRTKGWFAPAENGEFWYRFFRRNPAYVPHGEIDPKQAQAFRRSLYRFVRRCARPVVLKNLYVALRLEVLRVHLPEARYIVLHRNTLDNAQSILNARLKATGCYTNWWSVDTPNRTQLAVKDPAEQVLGQIQAIHQLIRREESRSGQAQAKFLHLSYETLCQDPRGCIEKVISFVPELSLRSNGFAALPDRFQIANAQITNRELWTRLEEVFDGLK